MINYSLSAKAYQMEAVRDLLDDGPDFGVLEIGTAGMKQVLATVKLNKPSGYVDGEDGGAVLTISANYGGFAVASGVPKETRMRNSNGVDVYTGLEVGTDIVIVGMKGGKLEKGQPIVLDKIRI